MDERHYVGIDVHQGRCVWCLVDPVETVAGEGTGRSAQAEPPFRSHPSG